MNEKLADAGNLIELGEEDHIDFSAIMSGLEGSGKIPENMSSRPSFWVLLRNMDISGIPSK